MSQAQIKRFETWLRRCRDIALQHRWTIHLVEPEWGQWFTDGYSPEQAVNLLFKYEGKNNITKD